MELNQASIKTALDIGFQFEGSFRQSKLFKNQNRDTAWFSIIDSEWPALASQLETWLAPNNFDEQGRQKSALRAGKREAAPLPFPK